MKKGNWALVHKQNIVSQLDPQDIYITRWRIIQTPWASLFLHALRRPDVDRHLHDHPFSFLSWVLKGGYVEMRPVHNSREPGARWYPSYRKRWSFARRRKTDLHKIQYLDESPTWTLILCGPRDAQNWGFMTENGWMHHEAYFEMIGFEDHYE